MLAPLRAEPDAGREQGEGREAELADLEARKEAKYREIRDAELDHAAGKLSDEDFRRQDAELRAEAVEILEQIDRLPQARARLQPPMATLLSVVQVAISMVLIFLVLLHSGKDAGLSGAFGIGGAGGGIGGGSMVERNLTRATIFFGVLWGINAIVLLKI